MNKLLPWQNKVAQGNALIGAGNTNNANGINNISKLGAGLANNFLNSKITIK